MCIRCQRHLPGALRHLAQRGVPAQVVAQHHDVDEEPDELVRLASLRSSHPGRRWGRLPPPALM